MSRGNLWVSGFALSWDGGCSFWGILSVIFCHLPLRMRLRVRCCIAAGDGKCINLDCRREGRGSVVVM